MEKTIKIEGMMCGHCEAAVKKALEELPEVESAEVSHVSGTAKVTLKAEIDNDVLKKAVEDKDYKVIGIEESCKQKKNREVIRPHGSFLQFCKIIS